MYVCMCVCLYITFVDCCHWHQTLSSNKAQTSLLLHVESFTEFLEKIHQDTRKTDIMLLRNRKQNFISLKKTKKNFIPVSPGEKLS